MDDSQSSDVFSDRGFSMYDASTIDIESYEMLLNKIKNSFNFNDNSNNTRMIDKFSVLLDDCRNCADQSFDIIISLSEDSQVDKACIYLENVVHILQILSNFIKSIIEVVPVTCCTVNTFPTYTGNIISLVFSHCKDSECIYGNNLTLVEKQLKELFRSCHELQLTYLMTLQKHFLFDLTVKNDQDVLLETLDINLKIGEIVQALDVKTMAEQWKAYTMICEKYSTFLLDRNIYNDCTKLLSSAIDNNINTALQAIEEDKIVVRSLKVASFSLKILLRISTIFQEATSNDYESIIQLLIYIKLCNSNYYDLIENKSPKFCNTVYGHLSIPSQALVTQLVSEEKFITNVLLLNINDFKDFKFLGYIVLLISVVKAFLQKQKKRVSDVKNKIIERVFYVVQKCHIWFNIGLKFRSTANNTVLYGLYEHLMIHTTAFVLTFTAEEYTIIEKTLLESILAHDYYKAVFSANIWVLLCRMGNHQLHINTLHSLLKIYQTLETQAAFNASPQQINLRYTIGKLFESLKYPEKMAIYKKIILQEDGNVGVWCALKVKNLPENLEIVVEKWIVEKLSGLFNEVCENEHNMDKLVKYMDLASTCTFVEHNAGMEDFLVKIWSKFCIRCNSLLQKLSSASIFYFRCVESLAHLTYEYKHKFKNGAGLVKVLNVMSNMLRFGNTELSLILFEPFCELLYVSEYDNEDLLISILKSFIPELEIQNQIFAILITNKEMCDFVIPILNKYSMLLELKNNFHLYKQKHEDILKWKEQLEIASDFMFHHKCIEAVSISNNVDINLKPQNINFDVDLESLFEDDEEPNKKKAKFDTNVEDIIIALENNAVQLSQVKENILSDEYKNRLTKVYEQLKNIIS
ncbi:unnamed protein product, partial [Brenthis ino]